MKNWQILFLIVGLLILPSAGSSQKSETELRQDDKRLRDMSLEELMNARTRVYSASKMEENLLNAPGIISVLTAEEIELFGAINLFEVLNRMPNVISSLGYALDKVAMRGGDFSTSGGQVALLLDGYPVRNVGGNETYYNIFYSFPLSRIKQIELIRGPGSVLYGTNAFYGVINIITKDGDHDGFSIDATVGQYHTRALDISAGHNTDDFQYHFAGFYSETDGAPLYSRGSEPAPGESFEMFIPQKNVSFNSKISYKNLRVNFHTSYSNKFINFVFDNNFIETYTKPGGQFTQLDYSTEFITFSTEHTTQILENIELKNSFSINDEHFQFQVGNLTPLEFRGTNYYAESLLRIKINKVLSLLSGINYRKITGEPSTTIAGGYDFDYLAYFGELKYSPTEGIHINLGAQYHKPFDYNGAFVPRLSALYRIDSNIGLKYSIARAFRSPDPTQYLVDNVVPTPDGSFLYIDKGNPDLNPEIVTTHDVQLSHNTDRLDLSISGFYSRAKDLILSRPQDFDIGDTTVTYLLFRDNIDYLTTFGLEFEGKLNLFKSPYVTTSFVYNQNEFAGEIKNYTLAPNYQFKLGLAFSQPGFSIATFLIASDSYKQIAGIRNAEENIADFNPDPNKFYDLSANVKVPLNKWVSNWGLPNTTLSIYGRNLLDFHHWQPDLFIHRVKSLPGMPGRNINIQLSFSL